MKKIFFLFLHLNPLKKLIFTLLAFAGIFAMSYYVSAFILDVKTSKLKPSIEVEEFKIYTKSFYLTVRFWLPLFALFVSFSQITRNIKDGFLAFFVANTETREGFLQKLLVISLGFSFLFSGIATIFLLIEKASILLVSEAFFRSFVLAFIWINLGYSLAFLMKTNKYLVLLLAYYYVENQFIPYLSLYIDKFYLQFFPVTLLQFPVAYKHQTGFALLGTVLFLLIYFLGYRKFQTTDL